MAKEIDINRLELRASKAAQALKRSYAGPIDVYAYHDTLYDAQQYAQSSPLAYVGQILVVLNTDEDDAEPDVYKIVDTSGTLESLSDAQVPIATTETPGIVKPDGSTITIEADGTIHSVGGGVIVDDQLSTTSTNPVQNKVITNKINEVEASEMKARLDGTNLILYK